MSKSELACTYAALILHDDGLEITADNLNSILKVGPMDCRVQPRTACTGVHSLWSAPFGGVRN